MCLWYIHTIFHKNIGDRYGINFTDFISTISDDSTFGKVFRQEM